MAQEPSSRGVPIYYTPGDAARVVGVVPATIKAAADSGRLPIAARTIGGVRLFAESDVVDFARRRKRP